MNREQVRASLGNPRRRWRLVELARSAETWFYFPRDVTASREMKTLYFINGKLVKYMEM